MITAPQCAQACADSYAADALWDNRWEADGVIACHRVADGFDIIALRGSITAEDWLRDAEAFPIWHPLIGFCHGGFLAGMDDVFAEVKATTTLPVIVTGHSLGGARARILAAIMATQNAAPTMVCTFGSPKPGFANMSRVIQKSGMAHISFRNRNDPVPLVAAVLPLWEHPEPWVAFDEAPAANDLEPLRDHHIGLYLQGAQKL